MFKDILPFKKCGDGLFSGLLELILLSRASTKVLLFVQLLDLRFYNRFELLDSRQLYLFLE